MAARRLQPCRVKDFRRFLQPGAPQSTKWIEDFLSAFDDATVDDVCSDVLALKAAPELRMCIAQLRGHPLEPGKGVCFSSIWPAEERSNGVLSSSVSCPGHPPSSMASVALNSAAAPAKLQRKLRKRWAKKCAKFIRKQDAKWRRDLERVEDQLRKALQEWVMVGNGLGFGVNEWKYKQPIAH